MASTLSSLTSCRLYAEKKSLSAVIDIMPIYRRRECKFLCTNFFTTCSPSHQVEKAIFITAFMVIILTKFFLRLPIDAYEEEGRN